MKTLFCTQGWKGAYYYLLSLAASFALAGVFSGCESTIQSGVFGIGVSTGPATPVSILVSTGNSQSAPAGSALSSSLVALVEDANSNPVPGVSVTWAVSAGGGSLSACTDTTNALGLVSCTLTTGVTAGTNTVTATAASIVTPATFTEIGNPANAASITVSSGSTQTATVATTLGSELVAVVEDTGSNPVPGVSVTWAVTAGGGSLSSCTSTTDISGLVHCSLTLGTTAGTNTVTASVTGIVTPATFTETGVPGAVTAVALSVTGSSSITANGSSTTALQATAIDTYGNGVPNASVSLNIPGSGGTTTSPATTNSSGVAAFTLTSSTVAGTFSYTASSNGHTSSSASVTFTAGAVTAVALVVTGSSSISANGSSTTTLQATATDTNGNPVPNASVGLNIPTHGGTTSSPATTNSSGIAAFTLTSSTVAGAYSYTATSNGHTSSSASVTFTAGAVTAVALADTGSSSIAANGSSTTTLQATATDTNGNPVPNASVGLNIPTHGGTTTSPATTNSSGVASFTLTSSIVSGVYSYTATSNSVTSSSASVTFTAGAVTAVSLSVTGSPSITANGSSTTTLQATATDANGNDVPNASVGLNIPSNGGTTTSPATTNSSGVASFTLTSSTLAGTYSYTATSNGHTSSSVSVAFTAGAVTAVSLSVTGSSSIAANGSSATTLQATATDTNGNDVPNASVALNIPTHGGTTTSPATTNSSGVAAFTLTSSIVAGVYGYTATSNSITSSSVSVTFTAGIASQIVYTSAPTASGSVDSNIGTVTFAVEDANSNPLSSYTGSVTLDFYTSSNCSGTALTQGANTFAAVTPVTNSPTGSFTSVWPKSTSIQSIQVTDGGSLTYGCQAITLNPGVYSSSQSAVTLSSGTEASGASTDVATMTAKDQFGNSNPTGTITPVTFTQSLVSSGTVSIGTVSPSTNTASGVFTATLTGVAAGALTIGGALNGTSVTSTQASLTVTAGTASKLAFVAGKEPSSTTSGATLGSIEVEIQDSNGNLASSASDTIVLSLTTPAGATLSGAVSQPTSGGIASFSGLSVNLAGTYTLTAISSGTYGTATSTSFTISAGTASKLAFVSGNEPSSATSGATLGSIEVEIQDSNGNLVSSASDTIALSLTTPAGATLSGTVSQPTSGGIASYSGLSVNLAGTYTLTATSSGSYGTATSTSLTISAGTATQIVYTAAPAAGTSVDSNIGTISFAVKDVNSNTVSSYTGSVTLKFYTSANCSTGLLTQGANTYAAITPVMNSTTGSFTTVWPKSTSIQSILVYDGGSLTYACQSITLNPGAVSAAQSFLTASSGSITSGATSTITLNLRDQFTNSSPTGFTSAVYTSSNTSVGTISGTAASATFTGITDGSSTISATIGGTAVSGAANPSITVTSGTATKIVYTAAPTAASSVDSNIGTVSFAVEDSNSNTVSSYTGSVTLKFYTSANCSTGLVTQGANTYAAITPVTNSATGSFTTVWPKSTTIASIQVTDGGSLTYACQAITLNPGAFSTSQSVVTLSGGSEVSGASTVTATMTAKDQFGNANPSGTLTPVTFTQSLVSSGTVSIGTVSPSTNTASGVFTATLTGVAAGTLTIGGALNGTSVTSTQASLTVTGGTASKLGFVAGKQPSSATSGATLGSIQVEVQDSNGNLISSASDTITLSLTTPAGATLSGTVSQPTSGGIASYSGLSVNLDGTYTLTATSSGSYGTTASTSFTISSGTATKIAYTAAPTAASNVDSNIGTVSFAVEDANSNIVSSYTGSVSLNFYTSANCSTGLVTQGTNTYAAITPVTNSPTGSFTTVWPKATSIQSIQVTDGGSLTYACQAITLNPGAYSTSQSAVTLSSGSEVSGASTVVATMTAKDQFGNSNPSGTLTPVTFSQTVVALGTVSIGTVSPSTNTSSGVFTATLTGVAVGTLTVGGALNGTPVTSAQASLTVTGVAPSTPTSLTFNSTSLAGQVALSWTASSTGTAPITYQILRGTSAGGESATPIATTTSTSYSDTTGTAGTHYYYEVNATNVAGTSSNSNEVNAIPMSAFSITSATVGNQQVVVSWGSVTGATSYTVEYGIATGIYTNYWSTAATSPTTVTGLTNGTTYYFRVNAVNSTGSALSSAESSATPTGPGNFQIISVNPGSTSAIISWNASANATSYAVKYGTSSGSFTTTFSANATSPTTVTGLTTNTVYYFMVTATESGVTINADSQVSMATLPGWSFRGPPSFGGYTYLGMAINPNTSPNGILVASQTSSADTHSAAYSYSAGSWTDLGGTDGITYKGQYHSIAVAPAAASNAGDVFVAFEDLSDANKLTVVQWNGSAWSVLGTAGFSSLTVTQTAIAVDNNGNVWVAYIGSDSNVYATEWTGSSWSTAVNVSGATVGTLGGITMNTATSPYTPYILYSASAYPQAANVSKYSAGSWSAVGSSFQRVSGGSSIAIDTTGVVYTAFPNTSNGDKLNAYKYSAGSWVAVGGTISAGIASSAKLAIDPTTNIPYVAYVDLSTKGKVTVQEYTGGAWIAAGGVGVSDLTASTSVQLAIDASGNRYLGAFLGSSISMYTWNASLDPGAAALGWSNTYPSSSTSLTASWQPSTSANISDQKVQFYSDEFCGTASGSLLDLSSTTASTENFTGVVGKTYTYRIETTYSSQDLVWSACSPPMSITSGMIFSSENALPVGTLVTPFHNVSSITSDSTGKIYVYYGDGNSGNGSMVSFSNGSWSYVGAEGSIDASSNILGLDPHDTPYALGWDNGGADPFSLNKYSFSSGTWSIPTGCSGFLNYEVTSPIGLPAPTMMFNPSTAEPVIAYIDENSGVNKPTVYVYNGSNAWNDIGSADFTTNAVSNSGTLFAFAAAMDSSGNPYVAFIDATIDQLFVMSYTGWTGSYTGGSWGYVGTSGTSGITSGSTKPACVAMMMNPNTGYPAVAYCDPSHTQNITVQQYNGTSWSDVGNVGFVSSGSDVAMAIDSSGNYWVVTAGSNSLWEYSGSTWTNVGVYSNDSATPYTPSITVDINGTPWVAWYDSVRNYDVFVKKYHP